jgi:hypothetical protein
MTYPVIIKPLGSQGKRSYKNGHDFHKFENLRQADADPSHISGQNQRTDPEKITTAVPRIDRTCEGPEEKSWENDR